MSPPFRQLPPLPDRHQNIPPGERHQPGTALRARQEGDGGGHEEPCAHHAQGALAHLLGAAVRAAGPLPPPPAAPRHAAPHLLQPGDDGAHLEVSGALLSNVQLCQVQT